MMLGTQVIRVPLRSKKRDPSVATACILTKKIHMNLNKQHTTDQHAVTQVSQRFQRLTVRQLCMLALSTMTLFTLCSILIVSIQQLEDALILGLCMSSTICLLAIVGSPQTVEINGSSVRFSNLTTLHRWRTFQVEEITDLSLFPYATGDLVVGLIATLRPSPARPWLRVDISAMCAFFGSDTKAIDSPLFLAFFAAVKRAHPHMKVRNLPATYQGLLPRA